ncbi:transketolase-like TK C-terminal-containing protein [Lichenicoccus sp.]|uniref:transketolase-like TK C-terminal-containing protein n=1 Tax=Lichenicoccus sp. TaxID=2781899 RepID=UPI003D0FD730
MDVEIAPDPLARMDIPVGANAGILAGALGQAVLRQPSRMAAALGMVEAASVLWSRFLRFDTADPRWPDRDRFVVGAARFAPLLRALLSLCGDEDEDSSRMLGFGQHPGVEMATGPAGQGIATGTGMALAERLLAARFGHSLVDHRTWVLACETDLSAGVALEAAALAGQMRLDRLTVLFELDARAAARDESQVPGEAPFGPLARFAACGWSVRRVDASDREALALAIAGSLRGRKPSLIACIVGREPSEASLPSPASAQLGRDAWRQCGRRGQAARRAWLRRLARHRDSGEFERVTAGRLPAGWRRGWREAWSGNAPEQPAPKQPAPKHGAGDARHALDALLALLPEFVSLSCEAGLPSMPQLGRVERALYLGTQEHGMASLLNGVALHGGLLACGSASFIAIDRMRPALRLSALMGRQVVHLLTHDGLALGEDGAAWQPVEQLASLRAMPNLAVFRPADGTEMMECFQLALQRTEGPSLIAFASSLPPNLREPDLRKDVVTRPSAALLANACARGGYVLADAAPARDVTLIATGAEIAIALEARLLLHERGIAAAVVSLPCWELFALQTASYRDSVLGQALRVGIEAASGFGWERWLGAGGVFIGIDDFGVCASADALYRRFGITPEAVCERVRRRLGIRLWPQDPVAQ